MVLNSTPLTALGISTLIVSAVSFALSRGQPKISPQASAILLQSGLENISAIVEELGLESKAVYVPSSMASGKNQALIPLHSNPHPPILGQIALPKRLIVKHGPNSEDVGLLISTPGSSVTSFVSSKADAAEGDLETAISLVLTGTLSLADASRVTRDGNAIRVEISNPRLEYRNMWVYKVIGSPIASLVASVVAEVLDQPISIVSEQTSKSKLLVELKQTGRSF